MNRHFKRFHAVFIILVLMLSLSGCTPATKNVRSIYLLNKRQVSFSSTRPPMVKNNVLYPATGKILIEKFDHYAYRNEILTTTEAAWMELLNSDSSDLAVSAATWLYFLSKEEVNLIDFQLLDLWTEHTKKNQLNHWKLYFRNHELK